MIDKFTHCEARTRRLQRCPRYAVDWFGSVGLCAMHAKLYDEDCSSWRDDASVLLFDGRVLYWDRRQNEDRVCRRGEIPHLSVGFDWPVDDGEEEDLV